MFVKRSLSPRRSLFSLVVIALGASLSATAQQRRALPTNLAAPAGEQAIAQAPAAQPLRFGLTLPLRNQSQLQLLLKQIADPSSPRYRHFLSAQQFAQQFSPTEEDYAQVIAYARAQGFTVTRTFANRLLVNVSATPASINQAFHVTMQTYKHPSEARNYYAPSIEPTVTATVPILSVVGLSTRDLPHPMLKHAATTTGAHADTTGSGQGGAFLGSDMRAAYVPGVSLDGAGQTVGLVELGPYNVSDVQAYFTAVNQPLNVPIYNVLLNVDGICSGTPTTGGCDDGEEVIDIQQAISMAPALSGLIVYEAYGSGSDALTAFAQAASDDTAKQLSLSFGFGGTPSTQPGYEQVFMELAAQGQSLFIASGDSGANVGNVGYPGNSPNVIDVGGTDLVTAGPGGPWQSESAWIGSGGGWSTQSPIPAYQVPVINGTNQGSPSYRNIPDLSLEANTDNYFCANGSCQGGIGGTSLAAPRWAGFLALVNEQANGTPVAFLNQTFYTLGQGSTYGNVFHDITTGNNFNAGSPDLFQAVPGFDLTSGWGTPNGQSMIDALVPAGAAAQPNFALTASPTAIHLTQGATGTATITLAPGSGFSGPVALSVTPVGSPAGVSASINPGTLTGAGQATLSVTTTSDTPAGNLVLAVTGSSGGIVQTAYVQLAIPDFTLQATPSTLYVNQGATAVSTVAVQAVNGFAQSVMLTAAGLPPGVHAAFSPAITASSSSLRFSATQTAETSSGNGITISGQAANTTRIVPSLALAVSAAYGFCGAGMPVDLSSAYNVAAVTTDGKAFTGGGLDGGGYAFSANLLAPSRVLSGTQFRFGTADVPNAVFAAGQTIALSPGRFTSLQLLATGVSGNQVGQPLLVTYADGTTATLKQSFSDWFSPAGNINEGEAVAMPYRNTAKGVQDARQFNLYGYTLVLDSAKTVKSLTLPTDRSLIVLAATLTTQPLGTPVDLSPAFNVAGIYTDGSTFPADGGLDGGGAAYSATLLGDAASPLSLVTGGSRFNLAVANAPDAVYTAGQTVKLPAGRFAQLQLLGTAVQGQQTAQPVTVTYTDGSVDRFAQSFSDWSSLTGYPNESLAIKTAYRDLNDGTQDNSPFNIYRYALNLNPEKTVASVTLPENRDVLVLAMTLSQNPLAQPSPLACRTPIGAPRAVSQ